MDETLRLEYSCTPAELKQAQELVLVNKMGAGSKWLAALVLILFLGGMLAAFWNRVEPPQRPYVFTLAGILMAVFVAMHHWREHRKKSEAETCLVEITPQEIRMAGKSGWAICPWSAFGKVVESETLFVLPDVSGFTLFTFPKRAFPDEASRAWFREVAEAARPAATTSVAPSELAAHTVLVMQPGGIKLEFYLRLSDYLDRALASWKTRCVMIVVAALLTGGFIKGAMNPQPNAVFSTTEMFIYFLPPALIVMELVIFLTFSIGTWMQHRKLLGPQVIAISEDGVSYQFADACGNTAWDKRVRYKETPWSFVIWWADTNVWLQLPKREFQTAEDTDRCREMLARHAARSSWYFG